MQRLKSKIVGLLSPMAVYFGGAWLAVEVLAFLSQRYGWPDKVIDIALIALVYGGVIFIARHFFHGPEQTGRSRKKEFSVYLVLTLPALFLVVSVFRSPAKILPTRKVESLKSIAILPFESIGGAKDAEYFNQGMVEDIIIHLSKIKDLRVIANNSSRRYVDSRKTVKQIGEELNVYAILEGTIRQNTNRVRISAKLIDSNTGDILWAEEYDRDLKEIFDVQSDVAAQIARSLKAEITPKEKGRLYQTYTDNIEAYKLYLKGRNFWDLRTRESFDSAEANFKHAVQLDPQYALAYSGLADCYLFNKKGLSQKDAIPIARSYATKALLLDSTLAEAWTTIAAIKSGFDYDWKGSMLDYEKAIQLNPNYPVARQFYGGMLVSFGEKEKGIAQLKKAIEIDPLSLAFHWGLALQYYRGREYEHSMQEFEKTLTINPKYDLALRDIAFVYLAQKNYKKAIAQWEALCSNPNITERPNLLLYLSYAYALSGDLVKSLQLKKQVMETLPLPPDYHYLLARILIAENKYEEAIDHLNNAYELKEFNIRFLKVDPTLDPIRNNLRFKMILKKIGLD